MSAHALRRIVVCADDYGISPAVNVGIRALIAARRLNATSVMMVGPAIAADDATAVMEVADGYCQIGLHITLTAPFEPMTQSFAPLRAGAFLPVNELLARALLGRLDAAPFRAEIDAQIAAFVARFGRPPDYFDGHQHAHLFPTIRDVFTSAVADGAPRAWVRHCGRRVPLASRLTQPKALVLDALSAGFRRRARRAGLAMNTSFAGAYDFAAAPDFRTLMRNFLDQTTDGGLVMCHPGHVDATLRALDPLTDQREAEWAYLASDAFADDLADRRIALADALSQPRI